MNTKKKSFVTLILAFILCLGLSTVAFADEDIFPAVSYSFNDLSVNVVFRAINADTQVETVISNDTVSTDMTLELLLVPQSSVLLTADQFDISFDPAYFSIATVASKKAISDVGALTVNTLSGSGRNVLRASFASDEAVELEKGDILLKLYLTPQQAISVTDLKNHISVEALNSLKSQTLYGITKCKSYVTNEDPAVMAQYMMSLTYFPSAVTATYDDTELSKSATVAQVEETISLSETYGVGGEAVTDFTLYTNEACTSALTDGGLQVGSNTLWVKTAFGGKTSVTVTALDTAGEDFQTILDQLAKDAAYQVTEDLDAPTTDLVLSDGKMLDLNGKTLKVKSLTLNSGAIIGGEGKFYGDLITSSITLTPSFTGTNGGWMPIKRTDSDGKYYAFEDVSATSIETNKEEKTKGDVETQAASQLAGIFTLHDFFKDNMEELVNEDNNYTFTLSVTVTTTATTVDFTQVDAEDQALKDPVQKEVVGGKVTFEMELNDAIKAALLDSQEIESVYALVKKTGSLTITDMTYELNIHNELFAKSSGTILLGTVGFNWLGFGS